MKPLGAAAGAAILLGALAIGSPALAFGGHAGRFHDSLWEVDGWRRNGWHGGWAGDYSGWDWTLGAGLSAGLGLGYGSSSGWDYPYGYPGYAYAPGYYASVPLVATTAPLVTGRSVALGGVGDFCATPVKTCQLLQPSYVGGGCSCRVPGGRARGTVTP